MKFTYTVRTKKGEVEKGEMEASSKDEAANLLGQKNLTPIAIIKHSGLNISLSSINALAPVPRVEKVVFSRQLSTLVNAGVPLVQSLGILEKQTSNPKMKSTVGEVLHDVEGGSSLSEALKKHPKTFNAVFVNLVHAGEVGGVLDQTLERLADQIEKDHEIVSKVRGAMMYPAVITVAMVAAVLFMMVSIIPQLADMFEEMNAQLPMSTKILIAVSKALTTYGIITFSVIIASVFLFRYSVKKIYGVRKKFHFFLLHIPVLGKMTKKINITRFTRTLGTLMASGISVIEALNIVADATSNTLFKEEIKEAAKKVKDGVPISASLDKSKNFPALVSQMIAVGEETGTLSDILLKISSFYDKEIDNTIKNLTSLLEPLLMILIGGMIGFVMVSIIKPIYQLTNMF